MKNLKLQFAGIDFLPEEETEQFLDEAELAKKELVEGIGPGSEFTGWIDLPVNYDKNEFARIKKAAEKIRNESEVLIVCGIGGSYLGALSAIDFLKGAMNNYKLMSKGNQKSDDFKENGDSKDPLIFFAGNNMSPSYIADIIEIIKDKDFSINVISKSGTTMETSIAFRIFKKLLEEKYGVKQAASRIYATTDKERGALKALAGKEGYEAFVVPDEVGGRFSVLTAVGLLPIAVSGADIDKLMQGAASMRAEILDEGADEPLEYAALRQQLYDWDKFIEIFVNYDPDLKNIGEWLKQLFGESEGKEGFGIFPASVNFTSDLHSMGQMIQEGERTIFETVINVENDKTSLMIPAFAEDFDGFKYLEGKEVDLLNQTAVKGTAAAHIAGDVPQIYIGIPKKDEFSLGELYYFFEFACGISAYIEGVNPFNQPGVEEYKKNIKALLAKYKN